MERGWTYRLTQWIARILCTVLWRFRCRGLDRVPRRRGIVVVSNHQSLLDLVLIGCALPRRLTFIARSGLRRHRLYRWVTRPFDVVDIERGRPGVRALRQAMDRINEGGAVLLFPEGTRTHDGRLGRLRMGFAVLARKTSAPIVPVRLDGAFQVWPRSRLVPRLGAIRLEVLDPFGPEDDVESRTHKALSPGPSLPSGKKSAV